MSNTREKRLADRESLTRGTRGEEAFPGVRRAHLRVLSRAFCNVAHDVQNHLAAVNESAGWMGDLLTLKDRGRFSWFRRLLKRGGPDLDVEPFVEILRAMEGQVAEGSVLNKRFSNFARRLETSASLFSANRALEEIQGVLLREAEKKGVDLKVELADTASMIEVDPSGFQLAVFCCAEEVLKCAEREDRVVLATEVREGCLHICVDCSRPLESRGEARGEADEGDFCRDMVEDLGGQIWKDPGEEKHVTTLAFPLAEDGA